MDKNLPCIKVDVKVAIARETAEMSGIILIDVSRVDT